MEKFKIYKITNDEGKTYIGSTKKTLNKRLHLHKAHFNSYLQGKAHYYTCFDVLVGNDVKIECIEELEEDKNSKHAKEREKYHIGCSECVNKNTPILTEEEKKKYIEDYRNETKEQYLKYQNEYYNTNKNKFTQYYKDNMEKIKNKQKQYYENNKNKILERQKNYYKSKKQDKNKE